jgi:Holliday junction resolvase
MNNQEYPTFRSSWEKEFYKYCERSENIIRWSTEFLAIPYISPKDGQEHRYFPDVFIQTESDRYIIEIKPHKQVQNPINQAKFRAAKEYADKNNYKFLVFTENELKKYGIIK